MGLEAVAGSASVSSTANSLGTGSPSSSLGETSGMIGGVGKNEFLKLLVAQLRNQDPMKPMEDKEFIAQMAQLNTVDQVTNMNLKLGELLSFQAMSQASNLIGKLVEAESSDSSSIVGTVQGVTLVGGEVKIVVNNKELDLSDIRAIAPGA
jgi:flagellar basal-body rod modification protein FlgD